MTERPTLAVGLMSGTSLNGMDAALVRLDGPTHARLLAFASRPYGMTERAELEAALTGGPRNSSPISTPGSGSGPPRPSRPCSTQGTPARRSSTSLPFPGRPFGMSHRG